MSLQFAMSGVARSVARRCPSGRGADAVAIAVTCVAAHRVFREGRLSEGLGR
jgi:hypothetical protein